jgi:hypothetical protein
MRSLAIIGTLLASSIVIAGQPVQVMGLGNSLDEAKINAIRIASEKYCGTNLLSDKIYKDYQTFYNEVTLYNSCFLKDIKVLSISESNDSFSVSLELTLIPTNQSRRLNIRTSQSNELNGTDADLVINHVKAKDSEALNYLRHFLNDYPYNAYSIIDSVKEPYFNYDRHNDKTLLIIPYAFQGNKNYFNALETTLLKFGKKRTFWNEVFKTDHIGRPQNNFDEIDKQITVDNTKIVIHDRSYYNFIADTIISKHPVLKVEIYDTQGNIVSVIYTELLHSTRLPALGGNLKLNYSVNNTLQYLYAGDTMPRRFQLEIDLSIQNIKAKDLGSVQTYIIPRNECKCERFISSKTYN